MKFSSISIFMILFCVLQVCAQDSFHNPYRFSYYIDYSTEFEDSIQIPEMTRIDVKYDAKRKSPICTILFNGEQKYLGRILDSNLDLDHQTFLLDSFFENKYNAYLCITRGSDFDDQKVGMIYYANPQEDIAPEKTCYCYFLSDVETTSDYQTISH